MPSPRRLPPQLPATGNDVPDFLNLPMHDGTPDCAGRELELSHAGPTGPAQAPDFTAVCRDIVRCDRQSGMRGQNQSELAPRTNQNVPMNSARYFCILFPSPGPED